MTPDERRPSTGERRALGPDERLVLAALADLLIPAEDGMPAASDADVPTSGVDYVLGLRPDLAGPLRGLLELARDRDPAEFLHGLDAGATAVLGEVVAGAYFLNDKVRDLVGYRGRPAVPAEEEEPDADLLAPVIARGPIYRDAP